MIDTIRRAVVESLELKRAFFAAHEEQIAAAARVLCDTFDAGGKVLLFGNGGSAADAQHIAAEWIGRFQRERRPLPAIALTTDTSILTAVANDYGYEQVFARQVRGLGRRGDVALAISTSGNSPNVLAGVAVAEELGMVTFGLTGGDGGKLAARVQHHFNVPHRSTARVQEVHIMIGHILCELVDAHVAGAPDR